jgi:hypothetical protein
MFKCKHQNMIFEKVQISDQQLRNRKHIFLICKTPIVGYKYVNFKFIQMKMLGK